MGECCILECLNAIYYDVSTNQEGASTNSNQFQYLFRSFNLLIEGFQSCHPVIRIGSIHPYDKYRVTILVDVGIIGNDQFFPLAFFIMEARNNDI